MLGLTLLAGTPARAGSAAPPAGSLAPADVEALRARYGQEALFRLRLGVDAARAEAPQSAGACPPPPLLWARSPQQRQFEQALAAAQPYAAGRILGAWQQLQERCGVASP